MVLAYFTSVGVNTKLGINKNVLKNEFCAHAAQVALTRFYHSIFKQLFIICQKMH